MSLPRTPVPSPLLRFALRVACTAAAAALSAQPTPLLPPFPARDRITPGENTPAPQLLANSILLPVIFTDATDRVYWDIPLTAQIPDRATALEIDIACSNPAPLRSLSLHLQSGKGWHAFQNPLVLSSVRQRLSLPRGLFKPEGSPDAWHKAKTLRLSAWKNTAGTASLSLFALAARTDTVAVIRATELTAPGATDFAASLADRCARLLTKAGIPFTVTDDALDALDSYTVLLLAYAPTLPERQLARLTHFVKKGGKLVVFYNASQPLGTLLGVRPGTWQGSDDGLEWCALIPDPTRLPDLLTRIPHLTNSLLPPFPTADYHARTVATWADATGRATDLPACVLTDRGAWFGHIPPLAYPSAAALFRAILSSLAPATLGPQPAPPNPQPAPLPPPSSSEIRGVWESSGYARHPRGWNGLLQVLSSHGINTLFAHWQSAGTAHYRTNGKRVESDRPRAHRSDPLADALDAGRKHNVAVHAWVTCWALEGTPADQRNTLTREGRLMRDAAGNTLPWLCPSIPENRALVLDGLRDLARRGVAGIHLDYMRYPENTGCYAPATRKAFEARRKAPVVAWPADVVPGATQAAAFQQFRRETITAFVREARDAVRAINPAIRCSAAVFPSPEAAALRGQDWPAWVREGLVDFVSPMIYTENDAVFAAALDACMLAVPNPQATLVPGIGTGADESQLSAAATALQIAHVRSHHLAGFAFFAVDDELLSAILPRIWQP